MIPGFFKKIAILLYVVILYLIPPCPLDQCCCPMHAGIRTEMAVFFEGLSKQNDVTTLNWGKGGMQISSQWVWQDGCFFEEPGLSPGNFFGLRMCKHKLEQIPFCTCHNPNPKTRSSSQLLLTNKECASTPPEAELHKLCFAQCTYSARTVHGTVHATVHGHKMLQIPRDRCFVDNLLKIKKSFLFLCFLIIFRKIRGIYSVLWPCIVMCTVVCTVCVLYVHCVKHDVCAPLYFHQQNAAMLLLEVCRHILR